MSYYELRRRLIALSKMLTRARIERRSRDVIDRLLYSIETTREQIEECNQ